MKNIPNATYVNLSFIKKGKKKMHYSKIIYSEMSKKYFSSST